MVYSSTMSSIVMRAAITLASILAIYLSTWSSVALTKIFNFAYVTLADDPHYVIKRRYTGLSLKQPHPAVFGGRTAVRESRVLGRSLGLQFKLVEKSVATENDVATVVKTLNREAGASIFLLDLPAAMLGVAARKLAKEPVLLFNVRNRNNDLRNENCAANLFHTLPSHRMLTDALAQYLLKKRWKKILVLRGPGESDRAYADAFVASARRLRMNIVDDRKFTLSNDPRKRSESNVALITGGFDYDVVFIADHHGEFGRYVPYKTYLPRPLVGDEGLMPAAWHWTWERHGAPQLNQRFARIEKNRHMSSEDWAAWASIKSVVTAIRKKKSTDLQVISKFLTNPATTIDTYKGSPSSFRAWNNQFRQPILMHTHNAVVARAPVDGFLHKINNLDTMGYDRRETKCQLTK